MSDNAVRLIIGMFALLYKNSPEFNEQSDEDKAVILKASAYIKENF